MKRLAKEIIEALDESLEEFGTYTFDDKGVNEVMDVGDFADRLHDLSALEAGVILREVASSNRTNDRGQRVAYEILEHLEDWDELFDIPDMVLIYNLEYKPKKVKNDLAERFQAVSDRIAELAEKVKKPLTDQEKKKILNEAIQLGVSLGNIALEKMERGDTK